MSDKETKRIAFAGDWHGDYYWAREAIAYAADEGADIIIHLGDFGYDFHRDFRTSIEASLRRANLTLQFVDGNHENFTWLYSQPLGEDGRREISNRVHHLPRGFRWTWNGVHFLAAGGAYSVDRPGRILGKSWWAEETITDDEVARCIEGGPVDVVVSHECPTGFVIPGIAGYARYIRPEHLTASQQHRQQFSRITDAVKPRWLWHGHYHVGYQQVVDLGYGPLTITGLDCNGTSITTNVMVIDIQELAARNAGSLLANVLSASQVGALIGGVTANTVLRYLWESQGDGKRYSDNPFPSPSGRLGRSPYWLPDRVPEIEAWHARRKGPGAGGGRRPRTRSN